MFVETDTKKLQWSHFDLLLLFQACCGYLLNLNSVCSFLTCFWDKIADVLQELLRSFPNLIMTTDPSNSTALHTAAAQGHTHVVDMLLDIDSNLAKIARNNGKTVLHTAARMGHLEIVRSLLSKDPEIGFRTDKKGQTALHMAAKGQNVDIVLELIKPNPAVLALEDNKGNTALHIAIKKGRVQVCLSVFLSRKATSTNLRFVMCELNVGYILYLEEKCW